MAGQGVPTVHNSKGNFLNGIFSRTAGKLRIPRSASQSSEAYVEIDGTAAAGNESYALQKAGGTFAMTRDVLAYSQVVASAAVTATSDETDFDQSYSIPANKLQVGSVIRIRGGGIATATNGTDTLTIKVYIGDVRMLVSAAVDVANNDIFTFDTEAVVRANGASGAIMAFSDFQSPGTSGTSTQKSTSATDITFDTTAAQVVKASATWSSNNAGNSCRLDMLNVSILPPNG